MLTRTIVGICVDKIYKECEWGKITDKNNIGLKLWACLQKNDFRVLGIEILHSTGNWREICLIYVEKELKRGQYNMLVGYMHYTC